MNISTSVLGWAAPKRWSKYRTANPNLILLYFVFNFFHYLKTSVLSTKVVSRILYLFIFDSFWHSGTCSWGFLFLSYERDPMLLLLWKGREREMRVLLCSSLTNAIAKKNPYPWCTISFTAPKISTFYTVNKKIGTWREKVSLSCFYYSLGEIFSDFTWCRIDSKCFLHPTM